MEHDLLNYVRRKLADNKGRWPSIAETTGIPYDTITKIAQGQTEDPRVNKLQRLADYFHAQKSRTAI